MFMSIFTDKKKSFKSKPKINYTFFLSILYFGSASELHTLNLTGQNYFFLEIIREKSNFELSMLKVSTTPGNGMCSWQTQFSIKLLEK